MASNCETNYYQDALDKAIGEANENSQAICADIIQGWVSDDSNTEDIVVDLRGCTLVGEFLNLECTTTSRSILLSNGTLQISDGIRVKRVDSIVFEKVVIIGERTGIILRESCAVFQDCTVKSRGTIAVVLDSDVKMNECHICDSESGNGLVVMGRRGLTTAEDCDFDGCNGSSIRVLRNGQIHLKNCSIKGSKTSVGMAVIGTGSKASAVSCEFLENQCNGIAVAEGSSLELEDCVIQDTKEYHGITIKDPGTIVHASQCDILSSDQCGIYISNGASAAIDQCVVKGSKTSSGVSVQGHGTEFKAKSCEFIDNQQCGVMVSGGARGILNGCVGKRSFELYGLGVSDKGTIVEAKGCHFSHNKVCGVYVYGGAKLKLDRCVARGGHPSRIVAPTEGGLGSNLLSVGKASMHGTISGGLNRSGVTILEGATATLSKCATCTGFLSGLTIVGGDSSVIAKKCDLGGESRDPRLEDAFSTLF